MVTWQIGGSARMVCSMGRHGRTARSILFELGVVGALAIQSGCAPTQSQCPTAAAPVGTNTAPAAPPVALTPATSAGVTSPAASPPGPEVVTIQIVNPAPEARAAETIAVSIAELTKYWITPKQISVVDDTGQQLLSQLVDMDGDEEPDELVFQGDFRPSETKSFSVRFGKRGLAPRESYRVYGRFVRERHDDFAWENDRIARRAYGQGLEVWQREPLTSSGFDAWVKRTKRLVVNDWYMTDDYHHDHGEGADFYSVGKSRGCGGLGIWSKNELHVSRNFVQSRVLANGPIRLVFELDYAPWDAGGMKVAETKRVILDAGRNYERFESTFKPVAGGELKVGLGIARHKGAELQVDPAGHWMRTYEPMGENGNFGCAIVLPERVAGVPQQTESDYLLIAPPSLAGHIEYYAGFGWDRNGDFADTAGWTRRVEAQARAVAAPPKVTLVRGAGALPWSARACESMIERDPSALTSRWHYDSGFVLMACEQVSQRYKNPKLWEFAKRAVDGLINPDGTIKGYKLEDYNIDDVNMGKAVFPLYEASKDASERQRYEAVLRLLRSQMKTHPKTKAGGYWHKQIYPHQMWLDGAYMAAPFLAKYAQVFNEPALFEEVANELILLERHTRDPKTGLLYHGWDESKQQRWANKATGTSPHFWGRAMGWYAMALVDVLELLPQNHPKRGVLIAILDRLATAVAKVQDPQTGVWWQVLDAPKRDKNYRESSGSAMFVYALSKGVARGWLDAKRFGTVAQRGWGGTLGEFVEVDRNGRLDLKQVCKVAGLGGEPYRDGSYEYYTSTEIVSNDPKGVGALIVASLERE